MSFPEPNTVRQINRQTGAIIATYGDAAGSYTFSPSTWSFEWQHYPIITADRDAAGVDAPVRLPRREHGGREPARVRRVHNRPHRQAADREVELHAGAYWAESRGMAIRLANGNTLVNYGTGGIIQEITPNKQVVFQAKFDHPTGTNDFYNRMVGYMVPVEDLYALNGGGPK